MDLIGKLRDLVMEPVPVQQPLATNEQEREYIPDPSAESAVEGMDNENEAIQTAYDMMDADDIAGISKLRAIINGLGDMTPMESKRSSVAFMLTHGVLGQITAEDLRGMIDRAKTTMEEAAKNIDDGCTAKAARLGEEIEDYKSRIQEAQREIAENKVLQDSSGAAFKDEIEKLNDLLSHLDTEEQKGE